MGQVAELLEAGSIREDADKPIETADELSEPILFRPPNQ